MPTAPTPIDALPPAPNPDDDDAVFDNAAFEWSDALQAWTDQSNALGAINYGNSLEAAASASAAAASQLAAGLSEGAAALSVSAAAAAANATPWTAKNYTFGDVVWSPTNGLNYRRQTAGTTASATDPNVNPAGWFLMGAPLSMPQQDITVATPVQLYAGIHYIVVHPLADMTMPANPVVQQVVRVTNRSGAVTPVLRGAFNGVVDDLQLNNPRADKTFTYTGPVRYWI